METGFNFIIINKKSSKLTEPPVLIDPTNRRNKVFANIFPNSLHPYTQLASSFFFVFVPTSSSVSLVFSARTKRTQIFCLKISAYKREWSFNFLPRCFRIYFVRIRIYLPSCLSSFFFPRVPVVFPNFICPCDCTNNANFFIEYKFGHRKQLLILFCWISMPYRSKYMHTVPCIQCYKIRKKRRKSAESVSLLCGRFKNMLQFQIFESVSNRLHFISSFASGVSAFCGNTHGTTASSAFVLPFEHANILNVATLSTPNSNIVANYNRM